MPDAGDRSRQRSGVVRGALAVLVAIAVVGFMMVLGELNPPRPPGISTDRLGPDRGQPVADYLAHARDSLTGEDTAEHWALVSFTEELRPEEIPAHSGGLRIGQVLHRVPLTDVQTPIVAVQVPAGDAVAVASADAAAWQLLDQLERTDPHAVGDRYHRVMTVSIARLRAGCACTVGLIVRGTLPRFRELAATNGIRAVEALPADAVAGAFGISPLLPQQLDVALPGPDTGPVPER
ncbi:hypothetical protein [Nocardia sp. NPDC050710]|uniref:hypothetical protein n=1 Tax=Nocardia sp. NPDC050710 TaxID=3157220 RepID=UPI00340D3387